MVLSGEQVILTPPISSSEAFIDSVSYNFYYSLSVINAANYYQRSVTSVCTNSNEGASLDFEDLKQMLGEKLPSLETQISELQQKVALSNLITTISNSWSQVKE